MANPIKGPRRHTLHTKLGRLIARRGIRMWQFAQASGVHPRMLTEYVSGRQQPSEAALTRMAQCLTVQPTAITESHYPYSAEDYAAEQQRNTTTSRKAAPHARVS